MNYICAWKHHSGCVICSDNNVYHYLTQQVYSSFREAIEHLETMFPDGSDIILPENSTKKEYIDSGLRISLRYVE